MIYLLAPQENYLEKVSDLLSNYDNTAEIKVILPTVASCLKLQNILVHRSRAGACFLPQIIPLMNLIADSEGVYSTPKEYLEPMSILEQKMLIGNIIADYSIREHPEKKISLTQSILLAAQVIRLFDEMRLYGVNFEDLKKVDIYNDAEHWQHMFEFLHYIYSSWESIQVQYGKVDSFTYRSNIIRMEIENIKQGRSSIIMAGIIPRGALISLLAESLAVSKENFLLIPQISLEDIKHEMVPTDKQYILAKFAPYMKEVKVPQTTVRRDSREIDKSITSNIGAEAELITSRAVEWLALGAEQVVIVSENANLINMLSESLAVKGVNSLNLKGYPLAKSKSYEFFLNVIKVFNSEYGINLENLLVLLKSSYLFSAEVVSFEYIIRKQEITSDEALSRSIVIQDYESEIYKILLSYSTKISSLFDNKAPLSFSILLRLHIQIAERLVGHLWNSEEGKCLADVLYDILNLEGPLEGPIIYSLEEYIEFIQVLISGARRFEKYSRQKVLFADLEDASVGGYQNIICADMNEGSMPRTLVQDPWMSNAMRVSLGMPDRAEVMGISWYYFDTLLNRGRVMLTRSTKVDGLETVASRFWLECEGEEKYYDSSSQPKNNLSLVEKPYEVICPSPLPSKIAATNLELLIRNPYGFYAKNILNLRKLHEIFDQNNLAKFGNFLHKVFQEYTNSYTPLEEDRYQTIRVIAEDLLQKEDSTITSLWMPKVREVLKAFLVFDEERRSHGVKVFAEIAGEIDIEVGERRIKVTAIADRVEIDSLGNIYILDYKTGTLPSKSDVLAGISVQMLIETIIANAQGFPSLQGKVKEVIYVKIASKAPYIETVSYSMEDIDLEEHYQGLKKILEYYDNSDNFLVNTNLQFAPKYDDYKHLARKYD